MNIRLRDDDNVAPVHHPPPTPPPEPLTAAVIGVSPRFLAPYVIDLNIRRKILTLKEGTFFVNDVNGDQWFMVRGKTLSIHDRRVLVDIADNPLVTFQQKLLTAHRRWVAYRGESTDPKDLLFTVRKSSVVQVMSKTELDVFMVGNMDEEGVCDFHIKGSYQELSCDIFIGGTNTMIAKMHRNHSFFSVYLGNDDFTVSIRPNVDYAFIISLVVILEEINTDKIHKKLKLGKS